MPETRVAIAWWRFLIHILFVVTMAFVFNALLRELFGPQGWLAETDMRGRTSIWIASLCLSLLAGRLFGRVFPLVPAASDAVDQG